MKKAIIILSSLVAAFLLVINLASKSASATLNLDEYSTNYHEAENASATTITSNFDGVIVVPKMHNANNPNNFIGVNLSFSSVINPSGYNAVMIRLQNMSPNSISGTNGLRIAYNHEGTSEFNIINNINSVVYLESDDEIVSVTTSDRGAFTIPANFNGNLIIPLNSNALNVESISSITIYSSIISNESWFKYVIGDVDFCSFNNSSKVISNVRNAFSINFETPNFTASFWDWVNSNDTDRDSAVYVFAIHQNEYKFINNDTEKSLYSYPLPNQMIEDLSIDDLVSVKNLKGLLFDYSNNSNSFSYQLELKNGSDNYTLKSDAYSLLIPDSGEAFWSTTNTIPNGFKGKVYIPYSNLNFDNVEELPTKISEDTKVLVKFNHNENTGFNLINVIWVFNDSNYVYTPKVVGENAIISVGNPLGMVAKGGIPSYSFTLKAGYNLEDVLFDEISVKDLVEKNDGVYFYTPIEFNNEIFEVVLSCEEYTISFVLSEYETLNSDLSKKVVYGDFFNLPIPEKEGYEFAGWYKLSGEMLTDHLGNSVSIYNYKKDISVYAEYKVSDGEYDIDMIPISCNSRSTVVTSSYNGITVNPLSHESDNPNAFIGVNLSVNSEIDKSFYNALIIRFTNSSTNQLNLRVAYNHAEGSNVFTIIHKASSNVYLLSGNKVSSSSSSTNGQFNVAGKFDGYIIVPFTDSEAFVNTNDINTITLYSSINKSQSWWKYVCGDVAYCNFDGSSNTITDRTTIWQIDFDNPNYSRDFWNWDTESYEDGGATKVNLTPIHKNEFIGTLNDTTDSGYSYKFSQEFIDAYSNNGVLDLSTVKGFMITAKNFSEKDLKLYVRLIDNEGAKFDSSAEAGCLFIPYAGDPFWQTITKGIPAGFNGRIYIQYSLNSFAGNKNLPVALDVTKASIDMYLLSSPNAKIIISNISIVVDDHDMFTAVNYECGEHGEIEVVGYAHGKAIKGDIKFVVIPSIGYTVDIVKYGEEEVSLTNNSFVAKDYDGKLFTVTFKQDDKKVLVHLEPNGGLLEENYSYLIAGANYSLPIPEKEGYVFTGWYDEFGNKICDSKGKSLETYNYLEEKTYYARYSERASNYELTEMSQVEKIPGIVYSSLDGVQVQTIQKTAINIFEGVTFNNLNELDWSLYNALVVEFESITGGTMNIRVAYNRDESSNFYARLNTDDPIYLLSGGEITRLAVSGNSGSAITTMFHDFSGFVKGELIIPIDNTLDVDNITIYGSINNKQNGSIYTFGKMYLASFEAPTENKIGKIMKKDLLWKVNYEIQNYSPSFWNWVADSTKTQEEIFNLVSTKKGEFIILEGYEDDVEYNISISDELLDAFADSSKQYIYMNEVDGIVMRVKNTCDDPISFELVLKSGYNSWKPKKAYYIPENGDSYWSNIEVEPGFDGLMIVPYLDYYWFDRDYTHISLPSVVINDNPLSLIISEIDCEGTQFVIESIAFSTELSKYIGLIKYETVGNGTVEVSDNDTGVVSIGEKVVFNVIPDYGYQVKSVLFDGRPIVLTNGQYIAEKYNGEKLVVEFSKKSFIVTLDSVGGEIENTSCTVEYLAQAKFGSPCKEGYYFLGWSLDKENLLTGENGKLDKFNIAEDVTLYAVWEKIENENSKGGCNSSLNASIILLGFLAISCLFVLRKEKEGNL